MYLLDTNVISELRKAPQNKADVHVVNWAKSVSANDLFISVITLLEIEMGILLIERKDALQGCELRKWLESQIIPTFLKRTIAFDIPEARACAQLHVPNPKLDRDAIIAATALVHDMTVVTRNTKDFVNSGVKLLNPWLKPSIS